MKYHTALTSYKKEEYQYSDEFYCEYFTVSGI